MKNHKLIDLFKTFSKDEIRDFADFISSPFYNRRRGVLNLYKLLILHYPDFENLDKAKIYTGLFPGKKYNDATYRVLLHYLSELTEKYITIKKFYGNKPEYNFHLKDALTERNQFKQAGKILAESLRDFQNLNIEAAERMYLNYRLHNEKLMFLSNTSASVFDKFLHNADLDTVFENLQDFYVYKTMSVYLNILNLRAIFKKDYQRTYFERVLSLITKEYCKEKPEIGIYYNLIKMIIEIDGEPYYREVLKILRNPLNTIHHTQLMEVYINLENYCTKMIREGESKYLKERFTLFKEELKSKIYLVEGFMPTVLYRNIVLSGLELKEYDWVMDFMRLYKKELHSDFRENTSNYCLALYGFHNKKFEDALKILAKIEYDEHYLKIDVKILQLMIYYEMEQMEGLVSAMEAFRQFLAKNDLIPDNRRSIFENFHKYLSKLIALYYRTDPAKLQNLKVRILKDKNCINKNWLIGKLEGLA